MDHAIQNVMKLAGLRLRDAITMATRNPARVGRIPYRQRGLNTGERADLVRFSYDDATGAIHVVETFINGSQVA
jgi:N-acetylglucosamine-6-phosphate deacetylase